MDEQAMVGLRSTHPTRFHGSCSLERLALGSHLADRLVAVGLDHGAFGGSTCQASTPSGVETNRTRFPSHSAVANPVSVLP